MDEFVHLKPNRNVCHFCNEQFTLKATLKSHLASKHNEAKRANHEDRLSDVKIGHSGLGTYESLPSPSRATDDIKSHNTDSIFSYNTDRSVSSSVYPTAQPTSIGNAAPLTNSSDPVNSCNRWRCDGCGKVFDARNKLEQHQTAKNHEGITTDNDTSGYETDTTIIAEAPRYYCSLCGKSFDVEARFIQHNASDGHRQRLTASINGIDFAAEKDKGTNLVAMIFTDQTCGSSTRSFGEEFADDETSDFETVEKKMTSSASDSASFSCSVCNKVFDVEARLNQHNASDGHRQKVKASKGGSVMEKQTELFPCNVGDCAKTFDNETKLLQHQGMKHGIKVGVIETESSGSEAMDFRCTEADCDRSFPTRVRLAQHMKDKHESEKIEATTVRQLCPHCDDFNEAACSKPFIFLTFIAKHILTAHEKPGYVKGTCPICSARVEKQKNLLTHISRAHLFSKFKDEACFICLRLCKDKDDLLLHSTSVHRFKCTIDSCHSMFPSKPLRDKHMLDKHQVYVCGAENCQRIFSTLEEKIAHMKTPHKGEAAGPIACSRGLANVHEGGVLSEPTASRMLLEQSPAHHSRNSADEGSMRSHGSPGSDHEAIHRSLRDKIEDLTAFITSFDLHLRSATNQECSNATFKSCDALKSAIDGVQRRLTPRVD